MSTSIFRNRIAIAYWVFAAIWMGLLILFTWIFIRDGAPEGTSAPLLQGLLVLFWFGGIALTGYTASQPCYFVAVEGDGLVTFTWRFPHRRVRRSYPAGQLSAPLVVTERGSDGEDYFVARITLPDGSAARLAEGHDRQVCQDALDRFTRAIGSAVPPTASD